MEAIRRSARGAVLADVLFRIFSELKRRLKADQKEKEKADKAKDKPAAPEKGTGGESRTANEEEMDPSEYRKMRIAAVEAQRESGAVKPFPHKFHVDLSLVDYNAKYEHLKTDELLADVTVSLAGWSSFALSLEMFAGRVMAKREASTKLYFYDLHGSGARLQLMANARHHADPAVDGALNPVHETVRRGDIIGVVGHPTRSKTGELSLMVTDLVVLTPCLHMMPHTHFGVKNQETRYRQRYLDLMYNAIVKEKFTVRARIISFIRMYLDMLGFLEVCCACPVRVWAACRSKRR